MRSARTKVVEIKKKSVFRKEAVTQSCWRLQGVYGRSRFPAVSCSKHTSPKDCGPCSTPLLPHHPNHPPPSSFQIISSGICQAHNPPAIHHNLKDLSTRGAAQAPDSQLQPPNQALQAEVRGFHHPG